METGWGGGGEEGGCRQSRRDEGGHLNASFALSTMPISQRHLHKGRCPSIDSCPDLWAGAKWQ